MRILKNVFKILILLFCSQIFGQTENDSITNEAQFVEKHIVTQSCENLANWEEKKECSKEKFRIEISKNLNEKILEKLTEKKHKVWCLFWFDTNGKLEITSVKTDNELLKAEFERIINKIDIEFYLKSENGNLTSGYFNLPIIIGKF